MRTSRAIVIPIIIALGVAASVLAGAETPAATAHTPGAHVQVTASSANPNMLHRD
jgi:hypothetical protein